MTSSGNRFTRREGYIGLIVTLIIETSILTLYLTDQVSTEMFFTLMNTGLILVAVVLALMVCEFDRRIEDFELDRDNLEHRWERVKTEALKRGYDLDAILDKVDRIIEFYDDNEHDLIRWGTTASKAYDLLGPSLQRYMERAEAKLERVEKMDGETKDELMKELFREIEEWGAEDIKPQSDIHP